MASRGNNRTNRKFTWAQAFRDIVVTSMNRGQLPLLGVMGLFGLVLWRLPDRDISGLLFAFLRGLKSGFFFGYVLALALAFSWYFHSKRMRREFSRECERIGHEKSDLQRKLLDLPYKSRKAS